MTATSLTTWVNTELLPSQVLELGFPRNISVETGRKWLHELVFFTVNRKKEFTTMTMKKKIYLIVEKSSCEK